MRRTTRLAESLRRKWIFFCIIRVFVHFLDSAIFGSHNSESSSFDFI